VQSLKPFTSILKPRLRTFAWNVAYIAYATFKTLIYNKGKLLFLSNSAFAKTPFKARTL
jgi:hypothetical protein